MLSNIFWSYSSSCFMDSLRTQNMAPSKEHECCVENNGIPAGADELKTRAMTALCHYESFPLAMWEPMDQLPAEDFIYPQKPHSNPPRMHYGLAVKAEHLYEYAFERRLVPTEWRGDEDCEYVVFQTAVKELDRLCGTRLYLEFPLGTDYDWMVARFTNYTWYYEELNLEEEEEVMDIIRRELCVHDSPRWYHGSRP